MGRLSGRTAVVTGAGRGWGRAIAVELAREGASVWISARTAAELDKTARHIQSIGGLVESHRVDLGDPDALKAYSDTILEKTRGVDILINNAGILQLTPIERLTPGEWSQTLAVNLTAPFLLIIAFLPGMKERGGSIINVSSRAGVLGFKEEVAYCTTKFGLEGMTRALAEDLSDTRVSVNTITPGLKIKPTSLTDEDFAALAADKRREWNDPALLNPAFVYLSGLRGEVTGLRFDAHRLSEALRREGFDITPERAKELAE
jgi:NAD(P)-dependent dehydrogenase (short-subunit alcohol dehydrogenase family)